jgi:hypothetical protein
MINEEVSLTKAHERHQLQVQPRTEAQSDVLQQNELNATIERETESGFYEDAASGAKARGHAIGRSHSGNTPDGEHSEDHQDLTDDDLEWLYSREELEERRRDLGTVWGRHR